MRDNWVRGFMQEWGAWRLDGGHRLGWPRRTMLGKAIDGMPSTRCTVCHGAGRVDGKRVGAYARWVTCPQCGGQGRVKLDPSMRKTNPAFIRSTRGPLIEDNRVCECIDRIVAGWRTSGLTLKYHFAIMYEYTRPGTQSDKARRMHISQGYYSKIVAYAEDMIGDEIIRLPAARATRSPGP